MRQQPHAAGRRVFWTSTTALRIEAGPPRSDSGTSYPNARIIHQPVHASWLNQIEIYFSVGQRKLLTYNDFPDLDTLADRLEAFEARYNKHLSLHCLSTLLTNAAEGACTEVQHRIHCAQRRTR